MQTLQKLIKHHGNPSAIIDHWDINSNRYAIWGFDDILTIDINQASDESLSYLQTKIDDWKKKAEANKVKEQKQKIEDDDKKEQVILNDFMNAIRNNKDYLKEFDQVEVKKTKKIGTQNNTYLSFDIVGKLKKKIMNRLDDISFSELKNKSEEDR